MNVTLRKIGNSVGVIIPKEMLDHFGLKEGDSIKLEKGEKAIEIYPQNADLGEQLQAARIGMEKYRVALRELAK